MKDNLVKKSIRKFEKLLEWSLKWLLIISAILVLAPLPYLLWFMLGVGDVMAPARYGSVGFGEILSFLVCIIIWVVQVAIVAILSIAGFGKLHGWAHTVNGRI